MFFFGAVLAIIFILCYLPVFLIFNAVLLPTSIILILSTAIFKLPIDKINVVPPIQLKIICIFQSLSFLLSLLAVNG